MTISLASSYMGNQLVDIQENKKIFKSELASSWINAKYMSTTTSLLVAILHNIGFFISFIDDFF